VDSAIDDPRSPAAAAVQQVGCSSSSTTSNGEQTTTFFTDRLHLMTRLIARLIITQVVPSSSNEDRVPFPSYFYSLFAIPKAATNEASTPSGTPASTPSSRPGFSPNQRA
ncbi:unnamed protein product, partial [Amoebophrya sp. A25]